MQTQAQESVTIEVEDLKSPDKDAPLRVLHVDDDLSVLEISKLILADMGNFEIENACCADEAFKKLQAKHYDVLISDYDMPLKDGLQFLKELREQKNNIPFILFTGKGREEIVIRALNLGADGYFNKQGDPEVVYGELIHGINLAVDRQRAKRALDESENRYKAIIEHAVDGILIQSADGKIVDANQSAVKMLRYSKEELLSMSIGDIDAKGPTDKIKKMWTEVSETKYVTFESEAKRKDGKLLPIEVTLGSLVLDGEKVMIGTARDITERKKTEEALRKSEARYRELANFLPDLVFETDLAGKFTFVNERASELTGFTQDELLGKNMLLYIVPEEREKATENVKKVMVHEHIGFHEYTLIRKDGSTFHALIRTSPITLENRVIGLRGVVIDITERKEMEDELRESEEKYRDLYENARDAIYMHDLKGKIIAVNKIVEEYGFTREQIIGKNMLKFIPKKYWPKLIFQLSQLAQGKRVEGEIEVVTPAGKRNAEYRSNPLIKGNKVVAVHSVLRDTTDGKKSEQAMLESQQKFSALFSANPEAALFSDTDFHVIEANNKFGSLFGYSFDEIKGKVVTDIIVPEEAKGKSREIRRKILSQPVEMVTSRKRKDGTLIPLFMSGGPVFVGGKVIGCVMVYKDISAIITVQDELGRALSKSEVLNEKLSVVGGFTRHDVANKLSAINAYCFILKKKYADNTDLADGLAKIEQSVKESMTIFAFARAYERLGAEELVDVGVEKIVDEAVGLFSGLRFKVINDCAGLTVRADSLLRQLIYNLIDNTGKYGGKVRIARVYYERDVEGTIRLIYEDDGDGIPWENKEKLFTKGFSTGGSSGFGLFLSKKMVEVYGWTIVENGEPGKGARFKITILEEKRKN